MPRKKSTSGQIRIDFEGKNITPESFTISEVAKILSLLEQAIKPIAKRDSNKEINLTLSSIQPGCMAVTMGSDSEQIFTKALVSIADAFKNNSLVKLPYLSISKLEELHRIIKNKKVNANLFSLTTKKGRLIGSISSDSFDFDSIDSLEGETTISGKIIKAGGKNPSITIELTPGYSFTCEGTLDQVKKLGENLYGTVSLSGTAFYDPDTYEIVSFRIKEIMKWNPRPINEVISEISDEFGEYYNSINMKEFNEIMRH